MNTLATGVMAGLMANGPLALGMMKLQDVGKASKPMRTGVAEKVNSNIGADSVIDTDFAKQLAYGTAIALLYTLIESKVKTSPLIKGGVLGLGVWGLGRTGFIPTLRLPPTGAAMGLSENSQMALAHVFWGASISQAVSALKSKG